MRHTGLTQRSALLFIIRDGKIKHRNWKWSRDSAIFLKTTALKCLNYSFLETVCSLKSWPEKRLFSLAFCHFCFLFVMEEHPVTFCPSSTYLHPALILMQSTFLLTPLYWCWCLTLLPAAGMRDRECWIPGTLGLKEGAAIGMEPRFSPWSWTAALSAWRNVLSRSAALPELWNNSSFYR